LPGIKKNSGHCGPLAAIGDSFESDGSKKYLKSVVPCFAGDIKTVGNF
jgi:hypothetical protein